MITVLPYFVFAFALAAAIALDPCLDEAARRLPARAWACARARRRR